jgi:hypothetical protein
MFFKAQELKIVDYYLVKKVGYFIKKITKYRNYLSGILYKERDTHLVDIFQMLFVQLLMSIHVLFTKHV